MKKAKNNKPKNFFRYVFLLLSAGLLALSLYVYLNSNQTGDYNDMKVVQTTDQKISVKVPSNMQEVQRGQTTIDYEDRLENENQSLLAHIRVESHYFGEDILSSSKQEIISQLQKKEGNYYEFFKNKTNNNPAARDLYFKSFSGNKVGDLDGLISDFNYKYEETPINGRLLIVFGNDKLYSMIIESNEDVWSKNLDVWQTSFDSLDIN